MDPLHPIIPNDPRLPILPARPAAAVKREQRPYDQQGQGGRREESEDDEDRGQDDPSQAAVVDLEAADDEPAANEEWGVYDDHGAYELRASGGQLHRAGPSDDQPADASASGPGGPGPDTGVRQAPPPRPPAATESPVTSQPGDDGDSGWHIDISA